LTLTTDLTLVGDDLPSAPRYRTESRVTLRTSCLPELSWLAIKEPYRGYKRNVRGPLLVLSLRKTQESGSINSMTRVSRLANLRRTKVIHKYSRHRSTFQSLERVLAAGQAWRRVGDRRGHRRLFKEGFRRVRLSLKWEL